MTPTARKGDKQGKSRKPPGSRGNLSRSFGPSCRLPAHSQMNSVRGTSQTLDGVAHRQCISRDLLNLAICHVDNKVQQSRSSEPEQRTRRDVQDCSDQQTRSRVVGEAASQRGGAEARGVHRGLQGVWAVPTPCVTKRPPRPVETGSGRSVSPSSTQLVSLGRPLLRGKSGRPSSSWSPHFGDRLSAALPDWTFARGSEAREDRHLGALKVVFCPQAHAGHW